MGVAFFVDYGSETKQQGEFITVLIPSGSETIQLVMARGAAREMAENMRRELAHIERAEAAAIILKFPPPELKPVSANHIAARSRRPSKAKKEV